MSSKIEIYTDGSAKNNPGKGGYGIIMRYEDKEKEYSEGFRKTTNNRMELLAVIKALEKLKRYDIPITIYSDSKYVIDSITKGWVFNWEKTNFKGKKNEDLWKRYLQLHKKFNIEYIWVKGHNNHPENERCDQLATNTSYDNIDTIYETLNKKLK
jgi:ribonuclease HI